MSQGRPNSNQSPPFTIAVLYVIQCGVFITRSIFSKILTIDTQQLTLEGKGELLGVYWHNSGNAWVTAVLYEQ